jgi:hypothetical protein
MHLAEVDLIHLSLSLLLINEVSLHFSLSLLLSIDIKFDERVSQDDVLAGFNSISIELLTRRSLGFI